MPECRGCGAEIEFVEIELKSGQRKQHPVDSPRRRVVEGRVTFDEEIGCYRILDARLKREPDGTLNVRAGRAWPVDGGAYVSHFDTCPDVAAKRMDEKRRARPRNEQEEIEREIEEASSHIQRCRVCGWPMDEALSADEAWRDHPACDPRNRLDDLTLEERNRLTGRRDARAQDAPAAEVAVAVQQEAARVLVKSRLRRAQETVDTEWRQTVIATGWDLGGELE
jgi:hypothetical protein